MHQNAAGQMQRRRRRKAALSNQMYPASVLSKRKIKKWRQEAHEWSTAYSLDDNVGHSDGLGESSIPVLHPRPADQKSMNGKFHLEFGPKQTKARARIRKKLMSDYENRIQPTKLEPSFLGKRRAENPARVPDGIIKFWDASVLPPPILRQPVRGVRRAKRVSSLKRGLAGPVECGAPNNLRWDWGGGYSAAEFELVKTHGRRSDLVSAEMKSTLKQYIERNSGEDIWNDEVFSRLARPLDATVFCSVAVRDELPGAGPRFVGDVELMYKHPAMSEMTRLKTLSRGSSVAYAPSSALPTIRQTISPSETNGSRGRIDGEFGDVHVRPSTRGSTPGEGFRNDGSVQVMSTSGRSDSVPISRGSSQQEASWGIDFFPPVEQSALVHSDSNMPPLHRLVRTPPIIPRRRAEVPESKVRHTSSSLELPFREITSSEFRIGGSRVGVTLTHIRSKMPTADIMSTYAPRPRTTPAMLGIPVTGVAPSNVPTHENFEGISLGEYFAKNNLETKWSKSRKRRTKSRQASARFSDSRQSMASLGEDSATPQFELAPHEAGKEGIVVSSRGSMISSRGSTTSDNDNWPVFQTTGFQGLPRGVSRTKAVFAVRRFPYGDDALHAANTIRRAWLGWFMWRHNNLAKAQALIRRYRSRTAFVEHMTTECRPAVVVIQKYARRFLAELELQRRRLYFFERKAVKIQARWRGIRGRIIARRWQQFVWLRSATHIQRTFRGYQGRKRYCRLRLQFLKYAQCATDIERVWRGYMYGRLIVRRIRTYAAVQIQRTGRGMLGRWRALNWLGIRSATVIQQLVRGHLGRLRAARVYKLRVETEERRMKRENDLVNAAIHKERLRLIAFFKIPGGKREVTKCVKVLKKERKVAREAYKSLSPFMKERADVENIFKRFDADHSGSIDATEFAAMIKDLCLPLTQNEIARTMCIIDTDGNGTIEFQEFYNWYLVDSKNDNASMVAESGGLSAGTLARIRFQLRARKAWRFITGSSIAQEARNRLLLESAQKVSRATRIKFRKQHNAPFYCPRCMRAFVFDYEVTKHDDRHPDCATTTVYDMLRREALEKEKEDGQIRALNELNEKRAKKLKEDEKKALVESFRERARLQEQEENNPV